MTNPRPTNYIPIVLAGIIFALLISVFVFRGPRTIVEGVFRFAFSGITSSTHTSSKTDLVAGTVNGRFSEPSIGFSFLVPSGYSATRTLSDSGETVLVQSTATSASSTNDGVEVYVRTYDGSAKDITAKNIETQARLSVQNPIAISISGAQGLGFLDTSSQPPLYEAWFVYNGYLFQTLAWESNATLLKSVLASWRFK